MFRICFILVQPNVPQNVGSAARAIKTIGFSDLRLVDSHIHQEDPARWLAHGSSEILDNVEVYPILKEAIGDCELTIGKTGRIRNRRKDYHPPFSQ